MFRIGIGQDSHKINSHNLKANNNKPLMLGGVLINESIKVEADSDGDIIIHSLCNALNTAIGYGSLDLYAGPLYRKGVTDSREYLKVALTKIYEKGFKINNVSFMIEAGRPRLEKHRQKITKSLAAILKINEENIGIAFTSGDKLTNFAKGKGIQSFCIASLVR